MKASRRAVTTTIDDVAALAGVSIKTVSRVLNQEPNVSDKTRRRVLEAAQQTQYRPNPSARSLARRSAYLLALLYDNPSDNYLEQVQAGALSSCRESGFNLLLHPCQYRDFALVEHVLAMVAQSRVDGLVLTPPICDVAPLLEALESAQIPFVRIAPIDRTRASPAVTVDDYQASYDLTSWLLSLGHSRIGFIKGHPDHGASYVRLDGYLAALANAGLSIDDSLLTQGHFDFDSGATCARQLLQRSDRPSAIFAANDDMAAAVLYVAHELNLQVPQDLSVAGFDDSTLSQYVWPGLTTVRQPIQAMGHAAVTALVRTIRTPQVDIAEEVLPVLSCELVLRASTGPAPVKLALTRREREHQ